MTTRTVPVTDLIMYENKAMAAATEAADWLVDEATLLREAGGESIDSVTRGLTAEILKVATEAQTLLSRLAARLAELTV